MNDDDKLIKQIEKLLDINKKLELEIERNDRVNKILLCTGIIFGIIITTITFSLCLMIK